MSPTYDAWIAHNPQHEWLGPEPAHVNEGPQEEAYTEACQEIARLKAILRRTAHTLASGWWDDYERAKLIAELRKAAQ
jgi:hypothetical protein